MSHTLCCCSPCRPTYRRNVDNVFPSNPSDGLVKDKMATLVYYAMTSPEKLDRIGEYLEQRVSREIYRGRKELAAIGMEAMDQLIKSCHINTLNLFVESFLKAVQRLLESSDAELQMMASESFFQFSKIKEETPSYHRSYNFFIDRFSQMCHADHEQKEVKTKLRLAGLRGLHGVIRKTVNEDLSENIWEPVHMEKIVPSLLYNIEPKQHLSSSSSSPHVLQTPGTALSSTATTAMTTADDASSLDETSALADAILRELVHAASFAAIKSILRPLLQFLRDHNLWDEPGQVRALHVFRAILFSVQTDLAYLVIDRLMGHLHVQKLGIVQRASIAIVLSRIIGIGVGDATVGPAVLEIVNDLLKNLKESIYKEKTYDNSSSAPLQQLQHALLDALGEYTQRMPDFQKIEIMTFILSKVPVSEPHQQDHELQLILMKALYKVAEKHSTTLFSTTFSPQLLNTLLTLLQAADQDVRLLVLQTFHVLVDRHNNRDKLLQPVLEPTNLDLDCYPNTNKLDRSDHMFVQKSLLTIFSHFKRVLGEPGFGPDFVEAMYTTCALLHVETSALDESAIFLLDVIIGMQSIAQESGALSAENRFGLHAIAFCLLKLLAATINSAVLDDYVDAIVDARREKMELMLPPLTEECHPDLNPSVSDPQLLIDASVVKEALRSAGKDVQRIDSLVPLQQSFNNAVQSNSSSRRASTVSVNSVNVVEVDSLSSSPGLPRRPRPEGTTCADLKKVLEGPTYAERVLREKAVHERHLAIQMATFDELKAMATRTSFRDVLASLSTSMSDDDEDEDETTNKDDVIVVKNIFREKQPYEQLFPELFMTT